MVKFIDFSKQYEAIGGELEAKALEILRSSKYILSDEVKSFEAGLAEYCGVKYAVSVANGTDSLVLALKAAGVGPGDEVITTPFTFFATAEAISLVGATPVFVDIDENSLCLEPSKIEEKITPRTKAVLPVHIFGQMADMDKVVDIATRHNIKIIEDACQAIGAEHKQRKAGSVGHIGCFSFYPTKNLSCAGDGGALVTNDRGLYDKLLLLRNHGSKDRYVNEEIGYNSRLDEIQAGILNIKLKYLEQWNEDREFIASKYTAAFGRLPGIVVPYTGEHSKHVYHLYSVKVDDRDGFKDYLEEKGIGCGIYYPLPLYRQKPYRDSNSPALFPVTEKVVKQIISLPLYPGLSREDQERVIDCVTVYLMKRKDFND